MKLSQLLSKVKTDYKLLQSPLSPDSIDVEDIAIDSRLVKKNSVFFALQGKATDGSKFIFDAIEKGASAVITSDPAPLTRGVGGFFESASNHKLIQTSLTPIKINSRKIP